MDWATLEARFAALAAALWGWFRAGIKLLTALIGLVLTVAIAVIVTAWIVSFGLGLLPPGIAGVASYKQKEEQALQWRGGGGNHEAVKTRGMQCGGDQPTQTLAQKS